jgi:nitrate/nitrite-specific signal transduction histidine kinase
VTDTKSRMTEEQLLIQVIDKALAKHTVKLREAMRTIRLHIRNKEFHLATIMMIELTTTQANVSMELRSIMVKQGLIESEL